MASEFLSNEEIVVAAHKNLTQDNWDHLTGGSESETTMRRNRLAFDRWAFRPRVLANVSKIDTSTTFMGQRMRLPVLLAPVGGRFSPEASLAPAKAASDFGIIQVQSSAAQPSLEEVAATGPFPKVYQLYVNGDLEWTKPILERAKAAGFIGLCITADVAIYSRRERPLLGRQRTRNAGGRNWLAELTWEKLDRIKEMWGGPLWLKGVGTAEDAELAVQHGVDVVWVSNHGGRQLDAALGSLDVLPEVVQAVAGRVPVVLDGGVQRGGDILKAVALGANAVAIGKLWGWGQSAAGSAGILRVLEILENEIISAMGLIGVTSIDQLGPQYLCRAESVTPPHEMSAWVNIPKGRIL
ncbi:MAG TPA: alpha-hydroxy acid oxidase [Dehalococcoidia bacterium]|nr:alpha-hydroxy acid oxidase [Dehalococcoidia bacterium]